MRVKKFVIFFAQRLLIAIKKASHLSGASEFKNEYGFDDLSEYLSLFP
jgi:hypothetical protein